MKKLLLIVVMAALLIPSLACAQDAALPEADPEIVCASIGDVQFSFTNEQEYYDVTYKYPDEFVLEIKEDSDHVRDIHHYLVEGYEPDAVRLVVSRTKAYTPEERLKDVSFIDTVTTEEIDGTPWVIGTDDDNSVVIYVCAAGGYTYTFSFSSGYPEAFDFVDFARAFARNVKIPD